jgi:hypothetical protein
MKYFLSDCSVSGAEEEPVPSTKEDILGPVPKSESLEFSVTILPHIAAADDQVFSSNEVNTTVADISLKQIQSNSEEKFNAFEESTDSFPQTGMDQMLCTNNGYNYGFKMTVAGNIINYDL